MLFKKSSLEITGSCGTEFTVEIPNKKSLTGGVTHQAFQVTDRRSGQAVWLDFKGLGAGASVGASMLGPFGYSGSKKDFWSEGSCFYAGVLNFGEVELDEILNREVIVYTAGAGFMQSIGLTLIVVNPIPLLPAPLTFHSFAAIKGLSLSSGAGAGLMQYYGYMKRTGEPD